MQRIYLKIGENLELNNKIYTIESVLGDGATCVVYSAEYKDSNGYPHHANIKECYPYNASISREGTILKWELDDEKEQCLKAFDTTYKKLNVWQEGIANVSVYDICDANNTKYIIMEHNKGCVTFDKDKPETLSDILKTVKLLAHYIGKYHQNGYLHLDIKPSNFLVYPRPSEHIILFDLDTVTAISDIETGKCRYASYSDGWAAPEQKQGKINKLCPATDIYAIGAVLFEKIMGRPVNNDDIGYFAEWSFDGKLFEDVNPKIKRLLTNIFKKTLAANVKRRYQSTDKLILAIDEAISTAEQKMYLISDCIVSEINFVGRHDDLLKIDSLFNNDVKAVFLHGFGGVGKTSLAIKYAETYGKKYDFVKFCRYSNGLKQIIDSLEIANATVDNSDEHRKHLKTILKNSKTLIIIDNFDVEDDEDLEYLLSLDCNVLFTTRNDYSQYISAEKIQMINLEEFSTAELVQIFENEYCKKLSAKEIKCVKVIIEKFGNITFIVPMIAKQIIASRISIEDFALSVIDDKFARFNDKNEDIRILKDGRIQKINSLDYLRKMFNISTLSDEHKTVLKYLYLLRYHNRLTVSEYRKLTNTNNINTLNDLAFRNWITIEDNAIMENAKITVHQLVYDLIEKDHYPTYDSVSGITEYIDSCFDVLRNINDRNEVDWDTAECITFALLMYCDIYNSESDDTRIEKRTTLFRFMCLAFLDSPFDLYDLLFESPSNSNWHFNILGIMNMFDFDMVKIINKWSDYVKLLVKNSEQDNCLSYDLGNTFVEFLDENEKKEFIELMQKDISPSNEQLFANQIIIVPYFIMLLYFGSVEGESANVEEVIMDFESILQKACLLYNNDLSSFSIAEWTMYRLEFYLSICSRPRYNKNIELSASQGIDITKYYEYYTFVLKTIQYLLTLKLEDDVHQKYIEKAEEIIILLEEQNEGFAWYGLSDKEIAEYIPLTLQDRESNKKQHWSKKTDTWYASVEKTIEQCENPHDIYKLLLTFKYQKEILTNAKVSKLLKCNFVEKICSDNRLSHDSKKELLIDYVVLQARTLKVRNKKTNAFIRHHENSLRLFYQALSKIDLYYPELFDFNLDSNKVKIIDSFFLLRRYLKEEPIDLKVLVENCISIHNINYIGELVYLADRVRMCGYIKKSQEIKNKILDLCLCVDLSELSEETIQMILYKVRPLAVNYAREEVVRHIDKLDMNIERQYGLELLNSQKHELALKEYEKNRIANSFMNDYIDAVAIGIYNEIHLEKNADSLDEMEKSIKKHIDSWFKSSYEGFRYMLIFNDDKPELMYRMINPWWTVENYTSNKKEVNIGICYLAATVYENIPKGYEVIKSSLENLMYTNSYEITTEELSVITNHICSINPKTVSEIDLFIEEFFETC